MPTSRTWQIRHLHVADLWVQDRVRKRDFKLTKIPGADNPADISTKHVGHDILWKHMRTMNIESETGRAQSAPTIQHS